MSYSFGKKANEQKKAKKRQEKAARRQERKENKDKGKSLDDMIAYLDEFGNITDVPPEEQTRTEINLEDIQLGAAPIEEQPTEFTGVLVSFMENKGYGFIREDVSQETLFVHMNNMIGEIGERDKVSFKKEKTPKGFAAISVKKI